MEKSPSIAAIAKALSEFQSEMPTLGLDKEVDVKTRSGSSYKFKYSTMSNIIEKSKPILAKHKLSYSQIVESDSSVTTILMHESGEYIQGNLLIKGEDTPQGIGSAITYAKRYSLSSMLGIVADDDDDGNAAQGNTFKTKKPAEQIKPEKQKEEPKKEEPKEQPKEATKPTLTNKQIEKIAERIKNGENDLLDKVKEAYTLTEGQLGILEGVGKYVEIKFREMENQPKT